MVIGGKPLVSLTDDEMREALLALKDQQVPEGKTIEYKEALPGLGHSERREFLADLSSFANSAGGYLIYGIREDSGIPVELCGLSGIDADATIRQLGSLAATSIEPKIPGLTLRFVPVDSTTGCLVIHVPRSWAFPHAVNFERHWRFYIRENANRRLIDVPELRSLFVLSETAASQLRAFRTERLIMLTGAEAPLPLDQAACIALHVIPLSAFDAGAWIRFDIADLTRRYGLLTLPMSEAQSWDEQYNFDGVLTYVSGNARGTVSSYLQVFRNGGIEAVDTAPFLDASISQIGVKTLASWFEDRLITALRRYLDLQGQLGVEPPLVVLLALVGAAEYSIVNLQSRGGRQIHPFGRNVLAFPEIVIDRMDCNAAEVLRPIFDLVWNASGWPRSQSYDDTGKRRP